MSQPFAKHAVPSESVNQTDKSGPPTARPSLAGKYRHLPLMETLAEMKAEEKAIEAAKNRQLEN